MKVFSLTDSMGHKQTFQGFGQISKVIEKGTTIAIVHGEGCLLDIWELDDDKEAVEELKRFYRTDGFQVKIQLTIASGLITDQEVRIEEEP